MDPEVDVVDERVDERGGKRVEVGDERVEVVDERGGERVEVVDGWRRGTDVILGLDQCGRDVGTDPEVGVVDERARDGDSFQEVDQRVRGNLVAGDGEGVVANPDVGVVDERSRVKNRVLKEDPGGLRVDRGPEVGVVDERPLGESR